MNICVLQTSVCVYYLLAGGVIALLSVCAFTVVGDRI